MYKLNWLVDDGETTLQFYGQEIPGTVYKSHDEKVKNKDIKDRINELFNTDNVKSISFWKYPIRQNRLTSVRSVSGKVNENWESLL